MRIQRSVMGLLSVGVLLGSPAFARADDVKDEVKKDSHDVKRAIKKAGHRVEETACAGTRADCETRKAKHRMHETGERIGDKVDETTDKVKDGVE